MSAVAKRYARAAVEAAQESGGTDSIQLMAAGVKSFCAAYRATPELQELLENPGLKQQRDAVLTEVLLKLDLTKPAANLLRLLAANDRVSELDNISREIGQMADEKLGRTRAHIRSAVALTDDQSARLKGALEKRLGQTVTVEVAVEPALIGGLVCHVGDVTFDSSIRRQLDRMREQLDASVA